MKEIIGKSKNINDTFPKQIIVDQIEINDAQSIADKFKPTSVLPCFCKILEKIMYNRVYKYLTENNLLFQKQFRFRESHSTSHAIVNLVSNIYNSFNENKFTLGVFIDLSKAFDTVNHNILLNKLSLYGIKNNSLKWFSSYLSDRKQYVQTSVFKTTNLNVVCGVPQGSILGLLLFILYVNDLCRVSNILEPIVFADDTNLFFSHKNIKELFLNVNSELSKIIQWFNANKLSLNKAKPNIHISIKFDKKTIFH